VKAIGVVGIAWKASHGLDPLELRLRRDSVLRGLLFVDDDPDRWGPFCRVSSEMGLISTPRPRPVHRPTMARPMGIHPRPIRVVATGDPVDDATASHVTSSSEAQSLVIRLPW
jgi:hypothetical protein